MLCGGSAWKDEGAQRAQGEEGGTWRHGGCSAENNAEWFHVKIGRYSGCWKKLHSQGALGLLGMRGLSAKEEELPRVPNTLDCKPRNDYIQLFENFNCMPNK